MKNPIGTRIKEAREKLEITQADICKEFGITQSNYGRLEHGDSRISVIRLIQIAKVLKVSTEFLLHGRKIKDLKPDETISTSDGKVVIAYFKNKK